MKLKEHKAKAYKKTVAVNLSKNSYQKEKNNTELGLVFLGVILLFVTWKWATVKTSIGSAVKVSNLGSQDFFQEICDEVEGLLKDNNVTFSKRVEKEKKMDWDKNIQTDIDQFWVYYDMENGPFPGCYVRCSITPCEGRTSVSVWSGDTCQFYLNIGKPGFLFRATMNVIWKENIHKGVAA